jgi:RNA polymerase sigma-70 factor (ECF subfamily)
MVVQQNDDPASMNDDSAMGELWRQHRRYLLDVAYRMLGSVSEAEDVVQEGFTRLLNADIEHIDDVRGWLVVVVSRLCLDQLRSARARHEVYIGPWLPEPIVGTADGTTDPADKVTLDDSVRMALLLVLERLSPAERAAFVLHDVFQFSFDDVSTIVGRTPAACRQLASRARRHVREETGPARFDVDQERLSQVAEQFINAATAGDLNSLIELLDPNVIGHVDSGGIVPASRRLITGRDVIAPMFLKFLADLHVTLKPMPVNGEPGVIAFQDGRLIAVMALTVHRGRILQIHSIANPHKLAYVSERLSLHTKPAC